MIVFGCLCSLQDCAASKHSIFKQGLLLTFMIICITGTPGAGKTTLALLLARHIPALYIDANALMIKEKRYVSFDKARKTHIINPLEFKKRLSREIQRFKEAQERLQEKENLQPTYTLYSDAKQHLDSFFDALAKEHSLSFNNLRTKLVKMRLNRELAGSFSHPLMLIIDSHLSPMLMPREIDYCFVVETSLTTLSKRLKSRQYGALKRFENLQAEAFESSRGEAEDAGHKIILVRT